MPARILVIEDNPANLELMVYLLTATGHETMTATDGRKGLRAARENSPDLIICDVQMPEMNGYELAGALKAESLLRSIPLVAVTAFAMVGDRDKALSAGFDAYVAKPIEPEDFVSGIERLLPAALRSIPREAAVPATERSARRERRGRSILVVDDIQENLDFAQSLFGDDGYDVIASRDVFEALDLARKNNPDLIVSDVCMPATNGYDFIAAVKADGKLREIPFLFLTSTATSDADRSRGLALGAAGFLLRPIDPETLLAKVEACLFN
jgi:two-component system cell cycle response regulator